MMTQPEFIEALTKEHDICTAISRKKNADYSTGGDAFLNFRGAKNIGVDPAQAILVRMSDKMARAGVLIAKAQKGEKAAVVDEGIGDTLRDLANYALILKLFLEFGNE